MNQQGLLTQIKQGEIGCVYLFYGEERLLITQAIQSIKGQLLDPGVADFNFEVISGEKLGSKQLVELANSLPFMAERRIVVVESPLMLQTNAKAGEEGATKQEDEAFLAYLDDPNPQSCLILRGGDKVDKRKKIFKKLQEKAVVVEFEPLKGQVLERWISGYLSEAGKAIDGASLSYLSAMGHYTLEILEQELDKLIVYCGDRKQINLEMVRDIITKTIDANVFDLIDSIGNKRAKEAIAFLQELMYLGEAPLKIIALLVGHFRRIILLKDLKSQGYSDEQLKEKLKLHPFVMSKGLKQGAKFEMQHLLDFLEALLLAEVELKSTSVYGGEVLERLVIDLCYAK